MRELIAVLASGALFLSSCETDPIERGMRDAEWCPSGSEVDLIATRIKETRCSSTTACSDLPEDACMSWVSSPERDSCGIDPCLARECLDGLRAPGRDCHQAEPAACTAMWIPGCGDDHTPGLEP